MLTILTTNGLLILIKSKNLKVKIVLAHMWVCLFACFQKDINILAHKWVRLSEFTLGLFASAFCVELWQFYAAFGLQFLELAKYGVVRSLLSKCVHEDETGKMFSAFGILASVSPMIFNPLSRIIYNKTLETFPASVILICASLMFLATILNIVLYTQRWRIVGWFKIG